MERIQMLGIVENYNENTRVGYITGFDDLLYFFRQIDVKDNIILNKKDIVEFDYLIHEKNEMPIAIKIEKRKQK